MVVAAAPKALEGMAAGEGPAAASEAAYAIEESGGVSARATATAASA